MLAKTEGIVLKTSSYGESDKIVTLLTKELGKRNVMARGAKKPTSRFASATQPFAHGEFLLQQGRGMGSLSQADITDSARCIRSDLLVTAYASYASELVDRLTEFDQPSEAVFRLLHEALTAMEEGYDAEAICLFVEWKMLRVAGIRPVVEHCANCGATEGAFAFSFQQIGLLCDRCFSVDPYIVRLTAMQIRLMRLFMNVPIEQVGELKLKKQTKLFLKKIVRQVYDEQVGVSLKARRFLDQLERMPEFADSLQSPSGRAQAPDK